jgi:hypothetical protein
MEVGTGCDEIEQTIRQTIDSIPQDLDDLYRSIVIDIEKTPTALTLMRWVPCAQRPLTLDELRWAIIFDPDAHPGSHYASLKEYESVAPAFAKSKETMAIGIKTLSHGLLETVASANGCVVQFIHHTVMEFFNHGGLLLMKGEEGNAETSLDLAHDHIFRACINYLKMADVDAEQECSDSDFPLLKYASQFWITHAGLSQKSQESLLDHLGWPSNHFVDLWVRKYNTMHKSAITADCPPRGIGLAHVVARNGLTTSLSKMLGRKGEFDIDAPDSLERTPLVYAIERGYTAVVKALIEAGVCVRTEDYTGATPLHWAAFRRHTELMLLLLDHGAAPEAEAMGGCTPLVWAVEGRSEASARLLLEACDGTSLDREYVLPHRAYEERYSFLSPIRTRLQFHFVGGFCPWIPAPCTYHEWAPISWWQAISNAPLVRLVLPVINPLGDTLAVGRPYTSVYGHRTLLLRAVELEQKSIVRLLLDKGALPSLKGIHGWSPLELSKNRADKELFKMLEER